MLQVSSVGFHPAHCKLDGDEMELSAKREVVFCLVTEGFRLKCEMDVQRRPLIVQGVQSYRSLSVLVEDHPDLLESAQVAVLAKVANFLHAGLEYELIEDISIFKESYENTSQLRSQHSFFIDRGAYQLSVLHSPRIEGKDFVFYVKDQHNVPYRVSCGYPFKDSSSVEYQLLPYAAE